MKKILIVEDENHIAEGLRFNLEEEGFEAEIAADGQIALDKLFAENRKFDAIILDVMLPKVDGFEVARKLREECVYVSDNSAVFLRCSYRVEDGTIEFEFDKETAVREDGKQKLIDGGPRKRGPRRCEDHGQQRPQSATAARCPASRQDSPGRPYGTKRSTLADFKFRIGFAVDRAPHYVAQRVKNSDAITRRLLRTGR